MKMTLLPKVIYRFSAVPIKLQRVFLTELEQKKKKKIQFVWKYKRPQVAKTVLRKKNKAGRIKLPDFRV